MAKYWNRCCKVNNACDSPVIQRVLRDASESLCAVSKGSKSLDDISWNCHLRQLSIQLTPCCPQNNAVSTLPLYHLIIISTISTRKGKLRCLLGGNRHLHISLISHPLYDQKWYFDFSVRQRYPNANYNKYASCQSFVSWDDSGQFWNCRTYLNSCRR